MTSPRVALLKSRIKNVKNPDKIMANIIEVFTELDFIPDVGKYYTFVYFPRTPDITYDQHPLVAVTDVEKWGFRGINFHWGESRSYRWQEIIGNLHIIHNNEIEYLRSLRYAKIVTK